MSEKRTESSAADARLAAALRHWTPRFVANGVDPNDLRHTVEGIAAWSEWLPAWVAAAERHLALAETAEAEGHGLTAGEAYLRAAVCFHFAKFVWLLDLDEHRRATERAIACMYAAHRHLDPAAERIEVPFDGASLVGNLRRPPDAERPPLVLLLPGLDSTKEEFFHWEGVFLARGLATFSLDGPGQGETGFRLPLRGDYETAVTAAVDALETRTDLAGDRIGVAGVSLGGYYAARAGAGEPRVRALVSVSGPFAFGARWESIPAASRQTFSHYAHARDEEEARATAATFDLAPVIDRLVQPTLVVTGRLDGIVPWEETRRIADCAPNARFVLYDEGGHVCNNLSYLYRPFVADWLRDELERAG